MSNLNKKELDELLRLKGEIRGVVFHTDASYVFQREGQKGLDKLEKAVEELGYPIDYKNPKKTDWYPVGLRAISLLLIKDTFGWSDEDIKDMGWNAPSFSFIIKIFMKFFISIEKIAEETPTLWKEHYKDIGRLQPMEVDKEKKIFVLRIEDFKVHPIFCFYLHGYFKRVLSFALKTKKINSEETKCVFRGDSCDEFTIKWE